MFAGSVNVLYEDQLGVVDFHPSSNTAVLYISEGDLVMGQSYRRRVVKLRKVKTQKICSKLQKIFIPYPFMAVRVLFSS